MFSVYFPRGTGWVLTFDAQDKVIGPHWTQTQDRRKATKFATKESAHTAVVQYYGSEKAARVHIGEWTILPGE